MDSSITIFGSRRAYEFLPDDLRLTVLSTPAVTGLIHQAFSFQSAGVGTPPATFGEVRQSVPPGLVFAGGSFTSMGRIVPIRLLAIEPARIVIEIAGPTTAIAEIFGHLMEIVAQVSLIDGLKAIGAPQRVRDYSSMSARLAVPFEHLLAPEVRDAMSNLTSPNAAGRDGFALVPTIYLQAMRPDDIFSGIMGPQAGAAELAVRVGTTPEDHIIFSAGFLDSETHARLLEQLVTSLGACPQDGATPPGIGNDGA